MRKIELSFKTDVWDTNDFLVIEFHYKSIHSNLQSKRSETSFTFAKRTSICTCKEIVRQILQMQMFY